MEQKSSEYEILFCVENDALKLKSGCEAVNRQSLVVPDYRPRTIGRDGQPMTRRDILAHH